MTEISALKSKPPEANWAPRLSYLLSSAKAQQQHYRLYRDTENSIGPAPPKADPECRILRLHERVRNDRWCPCARQNCPIVSIIISPTACGYENDRKWENIGYELTGISGSVFTSDY